MEKLNQLMIADNGEITERQREFRDTHNEIVSSLTSMTNHALITASNLKKVRDKKLYEEAGFEDFEDYTEQAIGFKKRQALNYISVVEKLSGEYLEQNRGLGITKLIALAGISEKDREIVEDVVDVDSVTVAELKETIDRINAEKEDLIKQLNFDVPDRVNKMVEEQVTETKGLCEQIKKLKNEIKDLKSKPAPAPEKVEVKDEKSAADLKKAKEELKERDKAIADKEAEIDRLKKSATLAADESYLKFKVTFEQFQKVLGDLKVHLNALGPDKQGKARDIVKQLIGGVEL